MRRSTALFLSLLVAAPLVLAACGDDDDATSVDMPMSDSGTDGMMDGGMHDGGENSPVAAGAREIEVTATSFAFEPDQITISPGEDTAIVLTSDDLLHDFTIDELDAHVAADADETAKGGLRADEPGRYTYYCTVDGHREAGMEGTLIVQSP